MLLWLFKNKREEEIHFHGKRIWLYQIFFEYFIKLSQQRKDENSITVFDVI